MTNDTDLEASAIFWENWEVLVEFVGCLADKKIVAQLGELAKAEVGNTAHLTSIRVVEVSIEDITVYTGGCVTVTCEKLISGARSLKFLVHLARQLAPEVFPPDAIPPDEVVEAALGASRE